MLEINDTYLPYSLSSSDQKKQLQMIQKSKKQYKRGTYLSRPPVKSFLSKTSKHIEHAKQKYKVDRIGATHELAKRSGCRVRSLQEIIRKGEGAYFSSGSRPNQTPQSWGIARLASALTGGKAGAVDYYILSQGCRKGSRGYKSAQTAKRKYHTGHSPHRKRKILEKKLISVL